MIPLLRGQRQAHCPSAETAESQMPSTLSWGIGKAANLLKNPASILWQVFRGGQVLPTPVSGTTAAP